MSKQMISPNDIRVGQYYEDKVNGRFFVVTNVMTYESHDTPYVWVRFTDDEALSHSFPFHVFMHRVWGGEFVLDEPVRLNATLVGEAVLDIVSVADLYQVRLSEKVLLTVRDYEKARHELALHVAFWRG